MIKSLKQDHTVPPFVTSRFNGVRYFLWMLTRTLDKEIGKKEQIKKEKKKKRKEAGKKKTRRYTGGRKRTSEIRIMGIMSNFVDLTTDSSKFRVAISICAI